MRENLYRSTVWPLAAFKIHRFLKAKLFYNLGRSVTDSSFVNLGMLELSYRFQTLRDDFCSI